ncbi:hypothetical protein BHE74_00028364 [Ensete ventricosum]|nr:hypothetical protein GW17_00051775 [Ensete ventricosum]RWW64408.1 hypothetical protein BHE74_00028364 [Ensete ventricosum]RZS12291.1 hypothetical protein BHM03_00043717 [Ensete ventricosum]
MGERGRPACESRFRHVSTRFDEVEAETDLTWSEDDLTLRWFVIDTWCGVARGMTRDGGSAALFGGVHGDAAGKS